MKNGLVEKGDRFLVTNDMPTSGLAVEAAPASGGFKCTVPAGTVLVADGDQREGAPGFYCRPENYKEMEQSLVPEAATRLRRTQSTANGARELRCELVANQRLRSLRQPLDRSRRRRAEPLFQRQQQPHQRLELRR